MSKLTVDLFAEDRAHEEFVRALIHRILADEDQPAELRVRSARGGHGRALAMLALYQRTLTTLRAQMPDLLVVCIDANCDRFAEARKAIRSAIFESFRTSAVIACPDPHIERWFMADPESFARVLGAPPGDTTRKCQRDRYKQMLAEAVRQGGHAPTLGGIEFAQELAAEMDFYRAGKRMRSFKAFLEDFRNAVRVRARAGA